MWLCVLKIARSGGCQWLCLAGHQAGKQAGLTRTEHLLCFLSALFLSLSLALPSLGLDCLESSLFFPMQFSRPRFQWMEEEKAPREPEWLIFLQISTQSRAPPETPSHPEPLPSQKRGLSPVGAVFLKSGPGFLSLVSSTPEDERQPKPEPQHVHLRLPHKEDSRAEEALSLWSRLSLFTTRLPGTELRSSDLVASVFTH